MKLECGCEHIGDWNLIICKKHDDEFNAKYNPPCKNCKYSYAVSNITCPKCGAPR